MTFKEELDSQRKRLEEAQKRYFANRAKMEKDQVDNKDRDLAPKIVCPDYVAFSRSGPGEGTSMTPPLIACDIARYGQEKFYGGGGEASGESDSEDSSINAEPTPVNVSSEVQVFTIHIVKASTGDNTLCPQPPLNAEFILHLLLRHDEHDALIGDLIERYGKKCLRLGVCRANLWFYAEILWTALPLLKRALVKASGLVASGEWLRRHVL
jgi:hypothetical protein